MISPYIHYNYSNFVGSNNDPKKNASHLAANFTSRMVKVQYNYAVKMVKDAIRKHYIDKINTVRADSIGEEEYFKLLDNLQNNVLDKAANKMVNEVKTTNIAGYEINDATAEILRGNFQKTQQILNNFKAILKQLIGEDNYSNNTIFADLTAAKLAGNEDKVEKIKDIYKEAFSLEGQVFKVDNDYIRSLNSRQNQINKIMAYISAIESIQNGNYKGTIDIATKSKVINSMMFSIWQTLNIIVGFFSEDKLEKILSEDLFEDIKRIFSGIGNVTITTEGTKGTKIYNVKTEDISFKINLEGILNNRAEGMVEINIPGASLKRTNLKNSKNGKIANIKIKDTSLATLISNSNIGNNNKKIEEFLHAYADYNMPIKRDNNKAMLPAQLNRSASASMTEMYNYMHAAMLPTALAGSLNEEDLAYFIIINDEVFNVIELITRAKDGQDMVTSNLKTHQSKVRAANQSYYQPEVDPNSNREGEARSAALNNYIQNLNIIMKLKIALTNK